jgi:hypothetical protein
MKILVEAFQNYVDQRNVCGGLKVTGVLIGLQGGFMKFCCFLFLCDSRSTAEHYIKRDWESGKTQAPAKDSVQHIPVVNPMKIILPLLHIKL